MAYIILDKYLKVCGILSLEGNGCPFYDDLRTVQIADDSGKLWNDTLQISVPYGYPQTEMMMEGYHLLKQGNDGLWYCFRINDVTDALAGSVHVKQVQALNLCIWDLAHTQVEPATLSNCTSQQAYEHCLEKSDWTIHINTYTGGSKTGETFNLGDSAQTSLQQLNTDFSSEIRAYVVVSNGQVIAKYIDITDRLGEDTGRRIEYRRNMLDITRQMVDDQLFTKLYVYGGTPSGADAPISIASANNGADFIVDDTANDLYNGGGKYLEGYTSNESIDNAYGLLTWGKSQLALCNHPKYNYTVSVAALDWKPNLGDGVDVIDFDMQPELALSARAIQLQESEANPENNQVVIGEFVEIKVVTPSDIESLQKQADQTNAIAVDAAKRASAADAKADGKSTNYRSPDAPAAADINDTWEQTTGDGDDTPVIAKFTYTADGWKETSVTQKIETIIYSKNTVFGLSVDPPANAITNDLWYRDNQDGTSTLMQYDGTNWVSRTDQAIKEVTDVVATIPQSYYSAAQPTGNIVEGSTWYKETTASDGTITYDPYKYSDGAWVPVFDATAQEAADTAAAAQETAESKTQVFYGTATPTGAKEGDVWNQTNTTDDSVAVKQYINGVWQPIQGLEGPQGPQGVQGPAGANGQPTYTWIKYATSSAGANLSDDPTGKTYIGLAYNKTTATESTTATDYQWALIQGPQGPTGATGSQGVQGPTGPQGQATYTWIKYADTPTSGMSDDPTNKQYIGLAYNKTTATESTTYSDYQWARLYDASKKRNFTSTPYTPYDI
ncbi:MAG: phage tail spike protein, partial [Sporolactobacillus sp.]